MKRKFIMMSVLIQGPKQPDNNIDEYLRPLVEELLLLRKKVCLCGIRISKKASTYEHCCSLPSTIGLL
jgi:hypothetical protein